MLVLSSVDAETGHVLAVKAAKMGLLPTLPKQDNEVVH